MILGPPNSCCRWSIKNCGNWLHRRWLWRHPGQTLQATALVHEAYLRLVGVEQPQPWDSRGHFFPPLQAMRRILVDRARDRKRLKRGGEQGRIDLDGVDITLNTSPDELLALDEAVKKLATEYPRGADLVNLRFFAGLTRGEASMVMGIPRRTG